MSHREKMLNILQSRECTIMQDDPGRYVVIILSHDTIDKHTPRVSLTLYIHEGEVTRIRTTIVPCEKLGRKFLSSHAITLTEGQRYDAFHAFLSYKLLTLEQT